MLPAVARSYGFQARVTSGYRSPAKQAQLYQRFLQGLHPYPVAPPGTSDHEKGLALDVVSTNTQKLVSLLRSAGLYWGGPPDPVHFSLVPHQSEATKKKGYAAYAEEVGSSLPNIGWLLPGELGAIYNVLSGAESGQQLAVRKGKELANALLWILF